MSYPWHMEKITEYILVAAMPADFNAAVKAKIDEGHQPFGSPFVLQIREGGTVHICQAMVK